MSTCLQRLWNIKSVGANMTDPRLTAGEGEQVHFAKVIGRGQQGSVMWPAHGIDVRAVCSFWPDSWRRRKAFSQSSVWLRNGYAYAAHEQSRSRRFINQPKVLKLRVQVEVAHSTLRTVSMLVTCLPLDASPERVSTVVRMNPKSHFHKQKWLEFSFCSRFNNSRRTEEDFVVSWVGDEVTAVFGPVHVCDEAGVALRRQEFVTLTAQPSHWSDVSVAVFNAH